MRDIELLHPNVKEAAKLLVETCRKQGLDIAITQTQRTVEEQNVLYEQGRSRPGVIVTNCRGDGYSSPHQWCIAIDFCRNVKGREFDDGDGFFGKVGQVAKALGWQWGGDFVSFKDKPHLQMNTYGTEKDLKARYGTPEAWIKTWKK